jgi:hypothetical protein
VYLRARQLGFPLHVHAFCFTMSHPGQKAYDAFASAKREEVQQELRQRHPDVVSRSITILEGFVKDELRNKLRAIPETDRAEWYTKAGFEKDDKGKWKSAQEQQQKEQQ